MKHRLFGKKLGRNHNQRKSLFRTQSKDLFTHGFIQTTQAKAKALQPLVEKICSLAKKNDLASKRRIYRIFQDRHQVDIVCRQINQVFPQTSSNFTKITKIKVRQGDDSLIVKLHFVKDISFKKEEKVDNQKPKNSPKTIKTDRKPVKVAPKKK